MQVCYMTKRVIIEIKNIVRELIDLTGSPIRLDHISADGELQLVLKSIMKIAEEECELSSEDMSERLHRLVERKYLCERAVFSLYQRHSSLLLRTQRP